MGTIVLLAKMLEQLSDNKELGERGVEVTAFSIKIREIELPSEGFHQKLRRPLTLRIRHELDYWLISDYQTTVWGTGATVGEALLDYMREWKQQLHLLETCREELGPALLSDYQKLLRLIA